MNSESSNNDPAATAANQPGKSRWRRAFVATSILLSLIVTAVVAFPVVLRETALRDSLLNSSLQNCGLTGTSERVTGGWMTPITLHSITITDPNGNFTCTIPELRTSRSLTEMFTSGGDLGKVVVERAILKVSVDSEGNWPVAAQPSTQISKLEFAVLNSSFVLLAPWRTTPIVVLTEVDVTGRIQQNAAGRSELIVDECLLMDRKPLPETGTPQNLALIAPILSQSTRIDGTASVMLERTVVPLGPQEDGESEVLLSGRAEFHSLDARLKQDWVEQVAKLVGTATQTNIPSRIVVARDSVVEFQVLRGGVHHDGMAFLLPDLATGLVAETSGTIGLDETLDLDLAIHLPPSLQPADPFVAQFLRMLNGPLHARVTGTVSVPQLQMPTAAEVLSQMSNSVQPASHQETPPNVSRAVFNLIRGVSEPEPEPEKKAASIATGVLGLIRSIEASKNPQPTPESPDRE